MPIGIRVFDCGFITSWNSTFDQRNWKYFWSIVVKDLINQTYLQTFCGVIGNTNCLFSSSSVTMFADYNFNVKDTQKKKKKYVDQSDQMKWNEIIIFSMSIPIALNGYIKSHWLNLTNYRIIHFGSGGCICVWQVGVVGCVSNNYVYLFH